jgi:hypothetical protein
MKKILVVLLSVGLATVIFAGGTSVVFAQKVMRLAETHPQDYPTTKGDYEFARLVKDPNPDIKKVDVADHGDFERFF